MAEHVLEAHGIRYRVAPDVYDPSDDTFLLLEAVRKLPPGRLLEVGTGAGLVAIGAALEGHRVTATDASPSALRLARANARLNGARVGLVRADLLRGIRLAETDVAVFNPPYLPTAQHEHVPGWLDRAFDGGPSGLRVAQRFLDGLPHPRPIVLLLTSSLQEPREWHRILASNGLDAHVVCERRLPHEVLAVQRVEPTRKH